MAKLPDTLLDEIAIRWKKKLEELNVGVSKEGFEAFRVDISDFLAAHPEELRKTSTNRFYLDRGIEAHAKYTAEHVARYRTLAKVTPQTIYAVRASCGPHRWAC